MPGASSCCPHASGQVCPAEDTSDAFCWILEIPASSQCEATLGESHYGVVLGRGSRNGTFKGNWSCCHHHTTGRPSARSGPSFLQTVRYSGAAERTHSVPGAAGDNGTGHGRSYGGILGAKVAARRRSGGHDPCLADTGTGHSVPGATRPAHAGRAHEAHGKMATAPTGGPCRRMRRTSPPARAEVL